MCHQLINLQKTSCILHPQLPHVCSKYFRNPYYNPTNSTNSSLPSTNNLSILHRVQYKISCGGLVTRVFARLSLVCIFLLLMKPEPLLSRQPIYVCSISLPIIIFIIFFLLFLLPSRVYTSPSSPLYQCFLFVFLPQPIIILDSPVVLLVFALYCELFATTYVTSSLMPLSFRLTVPHPPHPTLLYLSIFKTIVTCPPLLSPFTSNSLLCQWSNLPWEGRGEKQYLSYI